MNILIEPVCAPDSASWLQILIFIASQMYSKYQPCMYVYTDQKLQSNRIAVLFSIVSYVQYSSLK